MARGGYIGYVHGLIDGDMSFRQFAMHCARAFGATITMRDEPSDAQIPEAFEPAPFYLERLQKGKKALDDWDALTIEQRTEQIHSEIAASKASIEATIKVLTEERLKIAKTLFQAESWNAEGCPEIRTEMIQWLTQSLNTDSREYYSRELEKLNDPSYPANELARRRSELIEDIDLSQNEYNKEVERVASRNRWLNALRASLEGIEEASA